MIRRLLAAIQFLTILPVRGSTAPPAAAAAFFPLVGALTGAGAAGVLAAASMAWPAGLAAALALLFAAALSGGLHEDGLADVADAFRAGRAPEKILAIMKDSRVGTYGALAVGLSLVVRWQAMAPLAPDRAWLLVPVYALSRGAMVALAAAGRPAGEGLGREFCAALGRGSTAAAIALGAAFALLADWPAAAWLLAVNAAAVAAARAYFHRRIGGVTGDCIGATAVLSEALSLLVLAWRTSI